MDRWHSQRLRSNSAGKGATTGHAKILGDDPLKLQIVDQAVYLGPLTLRGPLSLRVAGVQRRLVLRHLLPARRPGHASTKAITYNWPWLGPFVGFRYSKDFGKTWTQTPCTPAKPLFGEHAQGRAGQDRRPHFVDFGQNMEHSPDGKAYLVAHGASDGANRRFGYNSWITGDEVYLLRVTPGDREHERRLEVRVLRRHAAGRSDFAQDQADRRLARPDGLRDHDLQRAPEEIPDVRHGRHDHRLAYNTYILESDRITGPFKLVQYLRHFGEQAYFVNFPSKFISAGRPHALALLLRQLRHRLGRPSIRKNPPSSRYAWCLQEVRLLSRAIQS